MLKNIIITIYVIIIGIALTTIIFSTSRNSEGLIQFGNTIVVEVESNVLEPKIVKGDLVLVNENDKKVEEKDIISYITLEEGQTVIRTNEIAAITEDVNEVKIYSLKKEDGSIENIDDSCILGTYKATIPFAGTILGFLLSRQGFLIITLIPACILFVLFLVNFLLSLRKETQQ